MPTQAETLQLERAKAGANGLKGTLAPALLESGHPSELEWSEDFSFNSFNPAFNRSKDGGAAKTQQHRAQERGGENLNKEFSSFNCNGPGVSLRARLNCFLYHCGCRWTGQFDPPIDSLTTVSLESLLCQWRTKLSLSAAAFRGYISCSFPTRFQDLQPG